MNQKLKAIYRGFFDGRKDKDLDRYGLMSFMDGFYFLYYFGGDPNINGDIINGARLQDQINSWKK